MRLNSNKTTFHLQKRHSPKKAASKVKTAIFTIMVNQRSI